jgi:membrane protein
MNKAEKLLHAADRVQQGRRWLAIPVATWKKFGDDQAGNLAALIAYYAFASMFPLLLVFFSLLDFVLAGNEALRKKLEKTALDQYPLVGGHLHNLHLSKTGVALVIGLILTLFGARGVASAMQNAVNSVWEIPMARRPNFLWSTLRSLGLICVIGPGIIATITLSSIAGGTGHLGGAGTKIAAVVVALILNVGLFWLGFRLAAASEVRTGDLWLSAVLAAVIWQVLQFVAGYFVAHQLKSTSAYGVFGIVLGLLAWFALQATVTVFAIEADVVRARRLWPRSLTQPPLTSGDRSYLAAVAALETRRPEQRVTTTFTPAADHNPLHDRAATPTNATTTGHTKHNAADATVDDQT